MGYPRNDGYIGIGREATQGTGVGSTFWARYKSYDPLLENQWQEFNEGGGGRNAAFAEKVGVTVGGTLTMNMRAGWGGLLSCMALGGDVVSGAGPYVHTMTPGTLQWWSVNSRRLNSTLIERIVDAKANSVTYSGGAGELNQIVAELMGLKYAIVTADTPTYITDDILKFFQGTFTIFGAASVEVESFSLKILNNLEAIQTTALEYQQMVEKALRVELEMTVKATTKDEHGKVYLGGAAGTAPSATAEKSTVNIQFSNGGAGAALRKIEIQVPQLTWQAAVLEGLDAEGDPYRYAVNGIATYDGTNPMITVIATNADTAAYDGA